jgi:hypothetical protein
MADNSLERVRSRARAYLGCYAAWAALSALGLWVALGLTATVTDLTAIFTTNPWVIGLGYKVGLIVLMLLWLGYVTFLEGYLRAGVSARNLRTRIARALMALVIILGISLGLQTASWIARAPERAGLEALIS